MRDRRLLLPALALLVALIAVPVVLSKPPPASPPPPVASAHAGGDGSELTSAVLAEDQVSVRNYRKRLDELKSKNPFEQQFTDSPGDASADASSATDTETSAATGSVSDSDTTVTDGGTTIDSVTVDDSNGSSADGDGDGNGNGGSGDDKPNEPSQDDVETVTELFTHHVDLLIGLQGDPKVYINVKPMTVLPDDQTPVVAFLGTDEKGERAAFVISSQATALEGDAACVPNPENCLYLTLEKGESATIQYGPDGQVYELRLVKIRDVELKAD